MQEPDELLGFMRTGCAVIVQGKQSFLGQVLEFVSGDGLDKILRTSEVSIFFIRCMLYEVSAREVLSCIKKSQVCASPI